MVLERAGVLALIRSHLPDMGPAEERLAQHVLANPDQVVYSTVTGVAEGAGVGEATVIRFCQSLGFRGYQEFKLVLARDLVTREQNIQEDIKADDSLDMVVRKVSFASTRAIEDTARVLDSSQLEKAVAAIAAARKVLFIGVGASALTCLDAALKFGRIGVDAQAHLDTHTQTMAAALLQPGDVAVGISHTGSTKDTVDALRTAREAGATVGCIVNHARSPLAQVAQIVLLTASPETPLASGALRSKIAQLLVLDLLFTGVTLQLGDRAWQARERTARAVLDKLY